MINYLSLSFLLICCFFTYQIIRKKSDFQINYPNANNSNNNNNLTPSGINYATPIQTPGTIAKDNK